jgi:tellurite resistance protein TerC
VQESLREDFRVGFESVGNPVLWIGFTFVVLSMLALDLGVFHRRAHAVGVREALLWTLIWVGLSLAFNVVIYLQFGSQRALEYLTGYLIEKALSVDNIFVFLVVFSSFAVPAALQHRVLFWGILGAMVLRGAFIVIGAALVQAFHWAVYLFGIFLIFTGIKLLIHRVSSAHPEKNYVFRMFRRIVPSIGEYRDSRFTVVESGKRFATPLLLVLVAVEITDIAFAVDSIPAIFAITTDPFIVYTSNIFAILGLRALYFVLAGVMARFHYLNTGLALVLTFVGGKMILTDVYRVPIGLSLAIVAALLAISIIASVFSTSGKRGNRGKKDVAQVV